MTDTAPRDEDVYCPRCFQGRGQSARVVPALRPVHPRQHHGQLEGSGTRASRAGGRRTHPSACRSTAPMTKARPRPPVTRKRRYQATLARRLTRTRRPEALARQPIANELEERLRAVGPPPELFHFARRVADRCLSDSLAAADEAGGSARLRYRTPATQAPRPLRPRAATSCSRSPCRGWRPRREDS